MKQLLRRRARNRNREGPTSKERDISIDWPQDGTTSLKYKAQRERRVPNSSRIFNGEKNTGNFSSFRHSKRCKFMPKMHQNMSDKRSPSMLHRSIIGAPKMRINFSRSRK